MLKLLRHFLYLIFMLLAISACGGGDSAPPAGSSNWDEMVWDQDDWS